MIPKRSVAELGVHSFADPGANGRSEGGPGVVGVVEDLGDHDEGEGGGEGGGGERELGEEEGGEGGVDAGVEGSPQRQVPQERTEPPPAVRHLPRLQRAPRHYLHFLSFTSLHPCPQLGLLESFKRAHHACRCSDTCGQDFCGRTLADRESRTGTDAEVLSASVLEPCLSSRPKYSICDTIRRTFLAGPLFSQKM